MSFFTKNRKDIDTIVELYKRTIKNNYFELAVNYKSLTNEVLIKAKIDDTNVNTIFNYKEDKDELELFLQKGKVNSSELKNLVDKMIELKCVEIYQHGYLYNGVTNQYQAFSVALMYNNKTKYKGFAFFDKNSEYPPGVTESAKKIEDNIYFFETNRSIFE
ncbi:MAG TPA: hypothetical protein PKA44_03385 [Saprospiraceae bacterium]|jgi:hypothetical protein|nr:hypothetical protein [Saprospiraceae bacterium]